MDLLRFSEVPQHLRCDEPDENARTFFGKPLKIDAADAALAKLERAFGADQMRSEFAEARFVADQGNASALGGACQLLHHFLGTLSRRERFEHFHRRLALDTGREQIGRLLRADERAGEDVVELYLEPLQTDNAILEALTNSEVYAVVAFLLAENGIIEGTAVMDSLTLPAVRMPARDRFVADDRKGGPVFK